MSSSADIKACLKGGGGEGEGNVEGQSQGHVGAACDNGGNRTNVVQHSKPVWHHRGGKGANQCGLAVVL